MRRVLFLVLSTFALAALATIPAHSDPRAPSCNGYTKIVTATWNDPFIGHKVTATSTLKAAKGLGVCKLSSSTTAKVTLPATLPGGGGETVKLEQAPFRSYTSSARHNYRFTVKQGFVGVPVKQTFSFEAEFLGNGAKGRICYTGRACGPYTS